MIGGPVYILVETNEPCEGGRAPTLDLSLICKNGVPAAVDYWMHDGGSGYATLSIVASPEQTYDLSPHTEPDTVYYGTLDAVPPVGTTAIITLTNRAGLSVVRTLYNPGPSYCTINPPDPGGDHPDDNRSAADSSLPTGRFLALPEGARAAPRVAILQRGAAHDLWWLLAQLGEPADYIGSDFDPVATAAEYPVLLIPSGGLYGLASPPSQGGAGWFGLSGYLPVDDCCTVILYAGGLPLC